MLDFFCVIFAREPKHQHACHRPLDIQYFRTESSNSTLSPRAFHNDFFILLIQFWKISVPYQYIIDKTKSEISCQSKTHSPLPTNYYLTITYLIKMSTLIWSLSPPSCPSQLFHQDFISLFFPPPFCLLSSFFMQCMLHRQSFRVFSLQSAWVQIFQHLDFRVIT